MQQVPNTRSSLEHLSPAWFVPVMGWAGLGLAWTRAIDDLGEPARWIALACAGLASLLLLITVLASLWRLHAHPQAVRADLRHPVKHNFVSALPIAMVLLAALWLGLTQQYHFALGLLWWVGALGELSCTVWVLSRWMRLADQGATAWNALTPVIFLPLAGNLLVTLAGVPLGFTTWSAIQAGIGLMLWPVSLLMLMMRLFQAGPLPARLTPTWFIMIVPPSALALSVSLWHPGGGAVWAIWGMALISAMWALTHLKTIIAQSFGLPHWAMSFPLAAFSSATLMQAHSADGGWLSTPGLALLAVTSGVVLWLSRQTWRGLLRGDLLRPD